MTTWMFEVYYSPPIDAPRERQIGASVSQEGGRLDFREEVDEAPRTNVCLTYEFDSPEAAERAALRLRSFGEHVEGPTPYG